ncbi:MAG TPA: transcriptional regulator, partial [Candidatus Hydrogenedentes bacterium]|nr:transcriptional regulator [Candidatus Hydrogenedentota bacterium]
AISFYPTKNLGGAGDGGLAVPSTPEIAGALGMLRNHGGSRTYYHDIVGTNSRLDALQAAVLRVKLKHLDAWNEQRRANAEYYTRQFREISEVTPPVEREGRYHVYHQYVIRVPKRDAVREYLAQRGIGCAVFYPLALHRQPCFEPFGCAEADCPNADRASKEVLALPIYPELTTDQLDEVVEAVKAAISHA